MRKKTLAVLLLCALLKPAAADDPVRSEMRSLDDQVQGIKSDVLDIATELSLLEEQLLFPSSSQVTVFVALDDATTFRLDAVQLQIDGALATHHIYNFKELDALKSGGVQRIYMGNVATGQHELEVAMIGKLSNGKDFNVARRFTFEKGVEPSLLGLQLAPPAGSDASIVLEDW